MSNSSPPTPLVSSRWLWLLWGVFLLGLCGYEVTRWNLLPDDQPRWVTYFEPLHRDSTLFLLWWMVFPLAWFWPVDPRRDPPSRLPANDFDCPPRRWFVCATVLILSQLAVLKLAGKGWENYPPAYHDEYSYLLQAQTFLTGRLWTPSDPRMPELFDQLHVLNSGRMASRYYPGTGLWLAPWVAGSHAVWGEYFAALLATLLLFDLTRRVLGVRLGWLAAEFFVFSPGVGLFSNLLLAHLPGLVGIGVMLWGYAGWLRTSKSAFLIATGTGLAWATWCRPATAVGMGLPLAMHFVWLAWKRRPLEPARRVRWSDWFSVGLPLLMGAGGMLAYNQALTGNYLRSPYQEYQETYTPRHGYGFYNVTRGARQFGETPLPAVTRNYDAWAEELTPASSLPIAARRLWESLRFSFGLVPSLFLMLLATLGGCMCWFQKMKNVGSAESLDPPCVSTTLMILLMSGIGLHVIHIPYWYDGIMHFHYVFESLWLYPVGMVLGWRAFSQIAVQCHKPGLLWWGRGLLLLSVVTQFVDVPPYWLSRVTSERIGLTFAKRAYYQFDEFLEKSVTERPALVLIQPDPADRHMDYVTNTPPLTGPILRGRFIPGETNLDKVRDAFPDRTLYLFDAKTRRFKQ